MFTLFCAVFHQLENKIISKLLFMPFLINSTHLMQLIPLFAHTSSHFCIFGDIPLIIHYTAPYLIPNHPN